MTTVATNRVRTEPSYDSLSAVEQDSYVMLWQAADTATDNRYGLDRVMDLVLESGRVNLASNQSAQDGALLIRVLGNALKQDSYMFPVLERALESRWTPDRVLPIVTAASGETMRLDMVLHLAEQTDFTPKEFAKVAGAAFEHSRTDSQVQDLVRIADHSDASVDEIVRTIEDADRDNFFYPAQREAVVEALDPRPWEWSWK